MEQPDPPAWQDKLATLPQHLIPQHLLSRSMHWLTRRRAGWLKDAVIARFIRSFGVDMQQAMQPDARRYETFNAFFTRALRPDARPICPAEDGIASPVDGTVSQLGDIHDGRLFQAKGHDFGLTDLLGGQSSDSAAFENGSFATLYLSPRDYHRIHVPLDARLQRMIYIPGKLFAVKPSTVRSVPGLFARNERVVCLFDSSAGPMAVVLVGAIFVGSIETVWSGELTPARRRIPAEWNYHDKPMEFRKGDEFARFNMGSTAILLFAPGRCDWSPALSSGHSVRMGEQIARVKMPDGK